MRKLLSVLLVLALAGGIAAAGAVGASAATDITAKFTDPNFRAVVYDAIGKTAPAPILDTDVAKLDDYFDASYKDIQSLAGLEYFVNLKRLSCVGNQLTELPTLPSRLTSLSCLANQLTKLPTLPNSLIELYCSENQLTELPRLSNSLEVLDCSKNALGVLPTLPFSLRNLECAACKLTALPKLPNSLLSLDCGNFMYYKDGPYPTDPSTHNKIKALPTLPSGLSSLYCAGNQLTALDVTGLTLYRLDCSHNNMKSTSDVKGFTGTWDGTRLVFDPQDTPQTEPEPHFWDSWPAWAVWCLRYLGFGWIWMDL